jgi:predicted RNase H-like nuclease (RuvC/YqgF family)
MPVDLLPDSKEALQRWLIELHRDLREAELNLHRRLEPYSQELGALRGKLEEQSRTIDRLERVIDTLLLERQPRHTSQPVHTVQNVCAKEAPQPVTGDELQYKRP